MNHWRCILLFLMSFVCLGAKGEIVIMNVTGEVDTINETVQGIALGDEVSGVIVYDDERVFDDLLQTGEISNYSLGFVDTGSGLVQTQPGSIMLEIGSYIFTEKDDSLFLKYGLPSLAFIDGELVGMNFATGAIPGVFGLTDPLVQLSTVAPDGGSDDRFIFGVDRDFNGHNEDQFIAGQLYFSQLDISEIGAALQEIQALLSTPEGRRSSASDYDGEFGTELNKIIEMLLAPPGKNKNNK